MDISLLRLSACNFAQKEQRPATSGLAANAQRFHLVNRDRTLAPFLVSPEWGENRPRVGEPLTQPRSSHLAVGKGGVPAGERLPFLATKILPVRLKGLVARPRLLAVLPELPAKRLAVIKAPAGFGKSSLAATWAEKLEQGGNSVGWLTIDSDDDEATRFLFYVSQALHHACPDVGAGAIELGRGLIKPKP